MRDRDAVAALIDRTVAGARIPGRAERDDLRRELWTHFEAAAASGRDLDEALARFGGGTAAESLRRVYRRDYWACYVAKVVLSIVASSAVAFCIQLAVNLRFELGASAWRLPPYFWRTAALSIAVVLGFIAASEAARSAFNRSRAMVAIALYAAIYALAQAAYSPHMSPVLTATALVGAGSVCAQLERWVPRLLLGFAAFGATVYAAHFTLAGFSIGRAAVSGGVYVAMWASTLLIVGALHDRFGSLFQTTANS